MVFQGFTFFVAAAVGVGLLAYTLYKHSNALLYGPDNGDNHSYSYPPRPQEPPKSRKRKAGKDDCSICMEQLVDSFISLPCQHEFHIKCIQQWLKQNKNCPNCRTPFTLDF